MSCGVGFRHSWDLALLWLWHRPAATALIQLLLWESPYAVGVALKSKKKEKRKEKSLQTVNAGEGFEKREPSYIAGGNINWFIHNGEQYGGLEGFFWGGGA